MSENNEQKSALNLIQHCDSGSASPRSRRPVVQPRVLSPWRENQYVHILIARTSSARWRPFPEASCRQQRLEFAAVAPLQLLFCKAWPRATARHPRSKCSDAVKKQAEKAIDVLLREATTERGPPHGHSSVTERGRRTVNFIAGMTEGRGTETMKIGSHLKGGIIKTAMDLRAAATASDTMGPLHGAAKDSLMERGVTETPHGREGAGEPTVHAILAAPLPTRRGGCL